MTTTAKPPGTPSNYQARLWASRAAGSGNRGAERAAAGKPVRYHPTTAAAATRRVV